MANICRSPAAVAVFSRKASEKGYGNQFKIDSAGIGGWYTGEPADPRMLEHAGKRNYELKGVARKFDPVTDFDHFDLIIGMDEDIIRNLKLLARSDRDNEKIFSMTDFRINYRYNSIPDPYFGGEDGFELVLDLLEDCCDGLLTKLEKDFS